MSGNKKFPRTHAGRLAADMVLRYYTHDVARDSAALTYYLLFAIFPLLIFISTLLGLLELDVAYITSVLEPLLPADVVDVVRSYLEYVSANQSRQLLWFSLIFSIWFPMRASGCLMHSLRKHRQKIHLFPQRDICMLTAVCSKSFLSLLCTNGCHRISDIRCQICIYRVFRLL